jgi:hypothetical protein
LAHTVEQKMVNKSKLIFLSKTTPKVLEWAFLEKKGNLLEQIFSLENPAY